MTLDPDIKDTYRHNQYQKLLIGSREFMLGCNKMFRIVCSTNMSKLNV